VITGAQILHAFDRNTRNPGSFATILFLRTFTPLALVLWEERRSKCHLTLAADVHQRDQAAPRGVNVRNQRNDYDDEQWEKVSLKNRVTPGSCRFVTGQPYASTGHAKQ
jgi:hypothetical protein